jgi:hypothetical protein
MNSAAYRLFGREYMSIGDDRAALQQQHAIGHRQGLPLIMRHRDRAKSEFEDKFANPESRLFTQLGVEIGKGLVEKKDVRFIYERPADCDALHHQYDGRNRHRWRSTRVAAWRVGDTEVVRRGEGDRRA